MEKLEESEKEREIEGEEDTDSVHKDNNAWHRYLKDDINFWNKIIISNLIYPPYYCPKYNKSTFSINETQRDDLINHYDLRSSNKTCRYKSSMNSYSILKFVKTIRVSISYTIIKVYNRKKKCAKDLQTTLKRNINKSPNYNLITKFLKIIKQCISEYIKNSYNMKQKYTFTRKTSYSYH